MEAGEKLYYAFCWGLQCVSLEISQNGVCEEYLIQSISVNSCVEICQMFSMKVLEVVWTWGACGSAKSVLADRWAIYKRSFTSKIAVRVKPEKAFWRVSRCWQASRKEQRKGSFCQMYPIVVYWEHVLGSHCRKLTIYGTERRRMRGFYSLRTRSKYHGCSVSTDVELEKKRKLSKYKKSAENSGAQQRNCNGRGRGRVRMYPWNGIDKSSLDKSRQFKKSRFPCRVQYFPFIFLLYETVLRRLNFSKWCRRKNVARIPRVRGDY